MIKTLPKTRGEYCDIKGYNPDTCVIICGGKSTATYDYERDGKLTTFYRLLLLRDYYNDGWKAEWKGNKIKYCIISTRNIITLHNSYVESCALYFKTEKLRMEFLNNFEEMILDVKELI